MKNIWIKILLICGLIVLYGHLQAQGPPDPPGHGQTVNQPAGGGAPIGSGVAVLLTLGAAYGAKKVYDLRKKLDE